MADLKASESAKYDAADAVVSGSNRQLSVRGPTSTLSKPSRRSAGYRPAECLPVWGG